MSERSGDLTDAIDRLMSAGSMVLGVDFDGTLAPLVDHPDDAVPDERALDLLRSISTRPDVLVAIVSGRGLADLRARVGEVAGVTYVGEHGNDVDGSSVEPNPTLDEAVALIDRLAAIHPGATVERKRQSVTFHTRSLTPAAKGEIASTIRTWADSRDDIALIEGKEVFELTAATGNKGDAMLRLAGEDPMIYIGDDTTDETVFEVLRARDIGVKVGEGETLAPYRVKDVAGVVRILEQIALASR